MDRIMTIILIGTMAAWLYWISKAWASVVMTGEFDTNANLMQIICVGFYWLFYLGWEK